MQRAEVDGLPLAPAIRRVAISKTHPAIALLASKARKSRPAGLAHQSSAAIATAHARRLVCTHSAIHLFAEIATHRRNTRPAARNAAVGVDSTLTHKARHACYLHAPDTQPSFIFGGHTLATFMALVSRARAVEIPDLKQILRLGAEAGFDRHTIFQEQRILARFGPIGPYRRPVNEQRACNR